MSTARVRVRSLAKINLDLRVLNRRSDGYHDLRTIFQTVSLADTIDIECRPGRTRIDINSNFNISPNIIEKAADAILEITKKTARIGFVLQKRIPLGGGLGGGSSNAAAVLLALPALLGKPLSMEKRMEIAASLGSDVPFFLIGGTAVGIGRGTELYPLPELPSLPALLITPGIHVSTPDAYRALNRPQAESHAPARFQEAARHVAERDPPEAWNVENDFEPVVFRQHSHLELIKGKLLKLGARPALMSGSGSTMFGIFANRQIRDRAEAWFRKEFADNQVRRVSLIRRGQYRAMWRRQLGAGLDTKLWPWQSQDRYAK